MNALPNRIVGPNSAGRDLVGGDVHGCFRTLDRALSELGFDPDSDRLFGIGDHVCERAPNLIRLISIAVSREVNQEFLSCLSAR